MTPPDFFDRVGADLSERASPMVVKEVRQGLRTKAFWVFFTLLLVACLVAALVAFAASSTSDAGAGAFATFFGLLGVVQFFVIPFTAFRSMAREQEDETWVLLTLTGMGPRKVIRGKIGSFVLQGALYASGAAPFLLFSYFLNGIDLPTIVIALLFSAAYQVFLVTVAVSLATIAHTKMMRALLQFVVLAVLLQGLAMGIGVGVAISEAAQRQTFGVNFFFGSACLLFGMLSTAALLFEAAAAGLTLITENYTRGPRIAFLVQLLGGTALFIIASKVLNTKEVVVAGSIIACVYCVLVGTYVATDHDGLASTLESQRRSMFAPGGYRGFLVVVIGLVLSASTLVAFGTTLDLRARDLMVMIAAPAFALLYLCLPQIVGRWLPRGATQTVVMVRIVSLALLVLASGLPPLVGLLIAEPDTVWLNLFNPIIGVINIGKSDTHLELVTAWVAAGASLAVALRMLQKRDV